MDIELYDHDTGTRRTVPLGARVTVRLPETPTTGYLWQPDAEPLLRLVANRFEGEDEPRGAAGMRVLSFEAALPGSARLRLCKRRAWGHTEPVAEFTVELEVQPVSGSS